MAQPKQTFGGDDDDVEYIEEEKPKKLDLSKYSPPPDKNIREVFWQVMGAYATKSDVKKLLQKLEEERFALTRVAVGILDNPKSSMSGLSPGFIARYTLMMLLDAEWEFAFELFLGECKKTRGKAVEYIIQAMKKLMAVDIYKEKLVTQLKAMVRGRESSDFALRYIAELADKEVIMQMKSELTILARGDIGENQENAIKALSLIKNDEQVKKTFIVLLSHWDENVRLQIAEVLEKSKDDAVIETAKRRLKTEIDPRIKRILMKITKG